jgi:hypothetical protein
MVMTAHKKGSQIICRFREAIMNKFQHVRLAFDTQSFVVIASMRVMISALHYTCHVLSMAYIIHHRSNSLEFISLDQFSFAKPRIYVFSLTSGRK